MRNKIEESESTGIVTIGSVDIACAVLSDKSRVLCRDGLAKHFGDNFLVFAGRLDLTVREWRADGVNFLGLDSLDVIDMM